MDSSHVNLTMLNCGFYNRLMSPPILATKLYRPPPRPKAVLRPRLIAQLNDGLQRKLTLISAPAGFGKTSLVSEWLSNTSRKTAWLSLDNSDNDLGHFLTYLVAALKTIAPTIGDGVLAALQSPQPPSIESLLTALLNEITAIPENFILVLDDYHVIDAKPIDQALTFLLEHLPPQMHLVIATREDPQLPLARLRVRNQLTELRVADLRFNRAEAHGFLNQVMGLNLAAEDIAALDTRTEGWIAGLQLAAISMQGQSDTTQFIKSFTGSHHFVLDYLVEEVLQRQPESVQTFLLHTSILDRLCAPLCDAVLLHSTIPAHETLKYIEQANLFIIPLDNERRWYRYHHLFADLLRQRLHQNAATTTNDVGSSVAELHQRASAWYEANGLDIEAFHHAAAGNDLEHAARLVEGKGMPLIFRGAAAPVLNWLESLPKSVLDANPGLWVIYASALLFVNQMSSIEQKLQAAEAALQNFPLDDHTKDLIGHIASIRATVAVSQHDTETIITQSQRALDYLHPHNLPVRTAATWSMGYAYQLQGDRVAAHHAYTEALSTSQAIGHHIIIVMSALGLGNIQQANNQLHQAVETYHYALQMIGDPPIPVACEAHLGLAYIFYEWNQLEAAQHHAQQSIQLASQLINTDRIVACEVCLAQLKRAQKDVKGASLILAQASQIARHHNFVNRIPEVAAAQVLTLIQQGNLTAAENLAQSHILPVSQAHIYLARGDPSPALAVLEPVRQQVEARGWADKQLQVQVLQAIAHHMQGEKDQALHLLEEILTPTAANGFIRTFVDAGLPMAELLTEAAAHGIIPDYIHKLLTTFEAEWPQPENHPPTAEGLIEPLSQRELEILRLVASGLSNHEISERLFLALSTVKGHNQKIFDKLQVQRRTEAVARARELGLL